MKCKRCGRILKSKKSIKLGFGITCFKKMKEEKMNQKTLNEYLK